MNQIHERIKRAIDRFHQVHILVVGDIMLDIFEFCYSQHSKPIDSEKPGKRAYKSHKTIKVLGGAGNVAANLASLNTTVSLVGLTGNDEHYYRLRELTDQHSVTHCLIRDASRPTTVKARIYVDNEYLLRRDDEETHKADAQISTTLVNEVIREMKTCDVVILSDYDKGVFTAENAQQIVRECQKHAIPVVVDFKPANRTFFCGADIMAPNEQEARKLVPDFDASAPEEGLKTLHTLLGSKHVIVTLGAKGMCGYDGKSVFTIPGNAVQAVDAVGCGDTVRAALAIGLALGLSLQDAATLANDAAAVIVQKPATAAMTIEELRSFVDKKY